LAVFQDLQTQADRVLSGWGTSRAGPSRLLGKLVPEMIERRLHAKNSFYEMDDPGQDERGGKVPGVSVQEAHYPAKRTTPAFVTRF